MPRVLLKESDKRRPVRRYTVRVYEEETARRLEALAEVEGFREMSRFFVEGRLSVDKRGLSPFELQALEVLGFQLQYLGEMTALALEKLEKKDAPVCQALREQSTEVKESLLLVEAILGKIPIPQRKTGRRKR